jgi:hypothetical protein
LKVYVSWYLPPLQPEFVQSSSQDRHAADGPHARRVKPFDLIISFFFSLHSSPSKILGIISQPTMKLFIRLFLCAPVATGFLFSDPFTPKADLPKLVDSHSQQRLSVNLDIGNQGGSRLAVNGFILDLKNDIHCGIMAMPGKHGPHPKLSSGIRKLKVAEEGHFISQVGTEFVHVANACWEMIWRDNALSGFLVCGLDVSEEYSRNKARLPKGTTYISFTVWTKETLHEVQKKKQGILERAAQYQQTKKEELEKMEAADNIFSKALHYSKAYSAAVSYCFEPLEGIDQVPDALENVIAIHDDLFVYPTGVVWSQSLPHGKHVVLGSAALNPAS